MVTMKEGNAVVKVDSDLLKKVDEFIRKNKFLYSSKKQIVNLAIIEFLNSKISLNSGNFGSSKKPRSKEGFLNLNSLNKTNKKRGK